MYNIIIVKLLCYNVRVFCFILSYAFDLDSSFAIKRKLLDSIKRLPYSVVSMMHRSSVNDITKKIFLQLHSSNGQPSPPGKRLCSGDISTFVKLFTIDSFDTT